MAVSNLLELGKSALSASQVAIDVTGNNIANVNTVGYSRQSVSFQAIDSLNFSYGQLGQGVEVDEIYRHFDKFVESNLLDKYSDYSRWQTQSNQMYSVESIFNESNREGISSSLNNFFANWQDLSKRPDDMATREALLVDANNLAKLISDTQDNLEFIQLEMDLQIEQDVARVNELLETIRDLNKQITANTTPSHTPNSLLDERDMAIRELSELIDIDVHYEDNDVSILTKSGHTLVDEQSDFYLSLEGASSEKYLSHDSKYEGNIEFDGSDAFEYTFEIVQGNDTDPNAIPTVKVSIDGGISWLKNDDGTLLTAPLEPVDPTDPSKGTLPVVIKDLTISFDNAENFNSGDKFTVMPKTGLYWNSPTRDALNITPQTYINGTENTNRIIGGTLAASFQVRDTNVGKYMDKLDAFAEALIWETNYIHSQGAGLKQHTSTMGTYAVDDNNLALGKDASGLVFADRLVEGNVSFTLYDEHGDPIKTSELDFDPTTPEIENFDPSIHSLADVANAINNMNFGITPAPTTSPVKATIVGGQLLLESDPTQGYSFALSDDSAGLMAGLGINTFFEGEEAINMQVKTELMEDASYVNAGAVNADGSVYVGDSSIAVALAQLANEDIKISTSWENVTLTVVEYYAGLVSNVGSDTATANHNAAVQKALAEDLANQSSAISGVNLDEEMSLLIQFQHSYTASAKLITTADEMLQTLLSLKQ